MSKKNRVTIFWFRRDLRIEDNAAFHHALKNNSSVLPIFIFDKTILNALADEYDRRVDFIHQALNSIRKKLSEHGSSVYVIYDHPLSAFKKLLSEFELEAVYTNHDYEPAAILRDQNVKELLETNSIPFYTYKDQCIFEKSEISKADGNPYTVFTPFSKKWKSTLEEKHLNTFQCKKHFASLYKNKTFKIPSLEEIGFKKTDYVYKDPTVSLPLLKHYSKKRDIPALDATSHLGAHLRFGTISIRQLVKIAYKHSETWLNELIWREFFMMILSHFPQVTTKAFRPEYDRVEWRNNEKEFEKWCKGETGFPIVDAGMRELNSTGFMHNRVRMIVASFLVKDLLIDWRWGEAYFAQKLLDFDLSANNGNWQWAAGCGCDAAPYFRVFNPVEQQKKFDPHFEYIKKWVPEFGTSLYPSPMVDHGQARLRVIQAYKKALSENRQYSLL